MEATKRLNFSLGLLIRGNVVNKLRKFLDFEDVNYDLKAYDNWLDSDYVLVIRGEEAKVNSVGATIIKWFRALGED